ncbi:MAG: PilZ domain-containing protein [Desulfovibrio sp.]|jgi:hypothetical protein|nr:PilZ domain-containing protein [Desulfovibrio sp.]
MTQKQSPRFEERRLHVRYVCTAGAVCELAMRSGPHAFAVEDISAGGMRIKTPDKEAQNVFHEDDAVRIVSGGHGEPICPVEDLTGRVIWVGQEDGHVFVGIEFDEPLESKLDYYLHLFLESGANAR